MTEEPEAIPQPAQSATPTQQFTIANAEIKPISGHSNKITGTITDGTTTHAFWIMASDRFDPFMKKLWPQNPTNIDKESGAVLLVVYEGATQDRPLLQSEGGHWVNGFKPDTGTSETVETKKAIMAAFATQLSPHIERIKAEKKAAEEAAAEAAKNKAAVTPTEEKQEPAPIL
ncbi:MAG: hypothetical protein KA155_03430 [Alphaproteobacteria bacterium]|jgi:hypothetical protein|nr:hypothetical protein [Alphaproteobacteria bacterium]